MERDTNYAQVCVLMLVVQLSQQSCQSPDFLDTGSIELPLPNPQHLHHRTVPDGDKHCHPSVHMSLQIHNVEDPRPP